MRRIERQLLPGRAQGGIELRQRQARLDAHRHVSRRVLQDAPQAPGRNGDVVLAGVASDRQLGAITHRDGRQPRLTRRSHTRAQFFHRPREEYALRQLPIDLEGAHAGAGLNRLHADESTKTVSEICSGRHRLLTTALAGSDASSQRRRRASGRSCPDCSGPPDQTRAAVGSSRLGRPARRARASAQSSPPRSRVRR